MTNPFYITGTIPEEYFCDRENETKQIVNIIENRGNILLTSQRRMGKTQLIKHVYEQPSIKEHYHTFYIDIYPTTSLRELVLFMSKEIYTALVPKGKKIMDRFLSSIKSLSGSLGYDPTTGLAVYDVKLGDINNPELTLQEVFSYLEKADKPCIFAIDEFQQITQYPEKNIEALLRSYIQLMNNCLFIFAGSNRHILENMFNSPAKPFYNSTEQLYLDRIQKDKYTEFAITKVKEEGKTLPKETASFAYDLFEGHTYYVHYLLHKTFAKASPKATINTSDIQNTLTEILSERENTFSSIMNQLNLQQKETLVAIAKEGKATGVTSVNFIKKHKLKSPSSVQYAISTLLDKQYLSYENTKKSKVFHVTDRFFEMWLQQYY